MARLGTQLECQDCGAVVTVTGPGEIPPCACGSRYWRTIDLEPADPVKPYVLTRRDTIFLRAILVDPEA